jgi:hypothetical protein
MFILPPWFAWFLEVKIRTLFASELISGQNGDFLRYSKMVEIKHEKSPVKFSRSVQATPGKFGRSSRLLRGESQNSIGRETR